MLGESRRLFFGDLCAAVFNPDLQTDGYACKVLEQLHAPREVDGVGGTGFIGR